MRGAGEVAGNHDGVAFPCFAAVAEREVSQFGLAVVGRGRGSFSDGIGIVDAVALEVAEVAEGEELGRGGGLSFWRSRQRRRPARALAQGVSLGFQRGQKSRAPKGRQSVNGGISFPEIARVVFDSVLSSSSSNSS